MSTKALVLVTAVSVAAMFAVAAAVSSDGSRLVPTIEDQAPRDSRPGYARPASERERALQKQLASRAGDSRLMLELSALQESRGAIAEAEATLLTVLQVNPSHLPALHALSGLYSRSARFDRAIATVQRAAALSPADPAGHHLVATHYFVKSRDPVLDPELKQTYLQHGLAAEERALEADPYFVDALVYKNLLLRELAATNPDANERQALIREADAVRARAAEAQKQKSVAASSTRSAAGDFIMTSAPPPPPPPPVPGAGNIEWVYGDTSYTATGNPKPLVKIKDARPIYPPMQIKLGIQGTVVVEALVDRRGRITATRVVESVPLLDQTTIDAVRQWEFDPATIVGGVDAVVITVTARFVPPR